MQRLKDRMEHSDEDMDKLRIRYFYLQKQESFFLLNNSRDKTLYFICIGSHGGQWLDIVRGSSKQSCADLRVKGGDMPEVFLTNLHQYIIVEGVHDGGPAFSHPIYL